MYIVRYNHRSLKQATIIYWYFHFENGLFNRYIWYTLKKNTVCVIPHEAIDFAGRQTFKFVIRHLSIWMFYKILFKILSRKKQVNIFIKK